MDVTGNDDRIITTQWVNHATHGLIRLKGL